MEKNCGHFMPNASMFREGDTVIGEKQIIRRNTWLTASVPKTLTVLHTPEVQNFFTNHRF